MCVSRIIHGYKTIRKTIQQIIGFGQMCVVRYLEHRTRTPHGLHCCHCRRRRHRRSTSPIGRLALGSSYCSLWTWTLQTTQRCRQTTTAEAVAALWPSRPHYYLYRLALSRRPQWRWRAARHRRRRRRRPSCTTAATSAATATAGSVRSCCCCRPSIRRRH